MIPGKISSKLKCFQELFNDYDLCLLSIAVLKHHEEKQLRELMVYLAYTSYSYSPLRKSGQEHKQERILEEEADSEAMQWCCLLALILRLLVFSIQNHQTKDGTTHNILGPLLLISN